MIMGITGEVAAQAHEFLARPVGWESASSVRERMDCRRPFGQGRCPCRGLALRRRRQVPRGDAQCGRSVRGR